MIISQLPGRGRELAGRGARSEVDSAATVWQTESVPGSGNLNNPESEPYEPELERKLTAGRMGGKIAARTERKATEREQAEPRRRNLTGVRRAGRMARRWGKGLRCEVGETRERKLLRVSRPKQKVSTLTTEEW